MGIFESPDRADVNSKSILHTTISIGTSQVEVKASVTRDATRQSVFVYNSSNNTIWIGGTGVTTSGTTVGYPLLKGAGITLSIGDAALFAIANSASNNLFVMELA